ncbi:MAG: tetratricopeptide repeat protein [Thermoguttaceae bacterium]
MPFSPAGRMILACILGLAGGCATPFKAGTAASPAVAAVADAGAVAPAPGAVPPGGVPPGPAPPGVSLFGQVYPAAGYPAPTTQGVVPGAPATASGVVPAAASEAVPVAGSGPQPIVATPVRADGTKSDDDGGWEWSHLSPDYLWKQMRTSAGYGPDEKIARQAFQDGLALMRDKKFDEAAEKFYIASWRWPDSTLEEDALFLQGECYFFADRYGKAFDAYANLLKKRENTKYLDTVMPREFAIGRYWDQMDIKAHHWPMTPNFRDKSMPWFDAANNALGAYEQVRLHDPVGPLADSAVMATANLHFRYGEWEEAADSYDVLRKDYPKSQFQKDAHILGLQSVLRLYQGPNYDIAPLRRAEEIAKQTLVQFRGRLGPEERYVVETRARIIEQKAEREWVMARYYDQKSCYGAARQYYNSLLEHYPGTSFAGRARKRLEEIRTLPDEPPKRFVWLTGLFERER